MILNISELLKRNIEVLPFDITFNEDHILRDDFSLKVKSPICIYGNVYYDGEIVNVVGRISLIAEAQCSRCLSLFDNNMVIDFDEDFAKEPNSEGVYQISDDTINLRDMVIDNLILSMPLKPLCSNECKGLCPICGLNLNEGQCSCKDDEIDPRLSVLKDFFKGGQGGV